MSHLNFWLIHWVSSRLNRPFSYPACRKWSPFSPSISLSTSSHCLSLGHWPNYVGRSLNFTCKTITKLKQYSTKRKASNDVFTLNQPLTHKPFIILSSVFSLGTFMRLSSGTFSTFNLLILGLKVASICFFLPLSVLSIENQPENILNVSKAMVIDYARSSFSWDMNDIEMRILPW